MKKMSAIFLTTDGFCAVDGKPVTCLLEDNPDPAKLLRSLERVTPWRLTGCLSTIDFIRSGLMDGSIDNLLVIVLNISMTSEEGVMPRGKTCKMADDLLHVTDHWPQILLSSEVTLTQPISGRLFLYFRTIPD